MKTTIIFLLIILTATVSNAQLTMDSDGNVNISNALSTVKASGETSIPFKVFMGEQYSGFDNDNYITSAIFGPEGSYRAGGKLSFGDIGTLASHSLNVFIGEYGHTTDTDKLWLHGKNGTVWTAGGTATTTICQSYYSSGSYRFKFNVDAYTKSNILIGSDQDFKENIAPLSNSLGNLKKLQAVSYNLKDDPKTSLADSLTQDEGILDEKEKMNKEMFEAREAEMRHKKKKKRYGFIAQDLQKIYPDLVDTDDEGYLYVDYIGLIPIIVESLNEQQETIDAQSLKIKELEKLISSQNQDNGSKLKSSSDEGGGNIFLYQNTPNPFDHETEISYFLPEGIENAVIYVFDLTGDLELTKSIERSGKGSVSISGTELTPGMYVYSLIVDGKEVDSKRMILTD